MSERSRGRRFGGTKRLGDPSRPGSPNWGSWKTEPSGLRHLDLDPPGVVYEWTPRTSNGAIMGHPFLQGALAIISCWNHFGSDTWLPRRSLKQLKHSQRVRFSQREAHPLRSWRSCGSWRKKQSDLGTRRGEGEGLSH